MIFSDAIVEKGDEITLSVRDDLLNGNIIAPKYYQIPACTKCNSVISKLFGIKTHKTPDIENQGLKAHATTATIEEEKLTQKIEIVDETPHVEAHPTKIEGFNSGSKILGQNVSKFDSPKEINTASKLGVSVDELAKRCLDTSVGNIDKTLLNELKNVAKTKSAINTDIDYILRFENSEKESSILEQNKNNNESEIYIYESEECNPQFKVEKIQPLHLDTLPLFTIDDGTKDFKPTGFFRDSSPLLKASVEETVMEVPSQLNPYDQQAIPFYEYTNKEHILEDDPELETAAITETIRENEFENPIQAEEMLPKGALDQRKGTIENPETEEPLRPQPTVHNLYEPLLTFHGEVDNLSKTFKADHISNIFVTQQLLTSTDHTSSWRSDGISLRDENNSANSAISGTLPYPPRTSSTTSQQLETPPNSAISAHQNPGEYFDWKLPVQFSSHSPLNPYSSTPRMLIEHSVTRNVVFASLPELEVSEKSSQISNYMIDTKTPPKAPECTNNVHTTNISNTESVPLSIILKRIQEQSKLDYCRDLFSKAKADVIQANKSNCPPPPANNPPKAGPCKPIPKPKDDNPCPCPKKCPDKKDPCAKFLPFFFNTLYKKYNISDLKIPLQCTATALLYNTKINIPPSLALLTEDVIESLKKLGKTLNMSDSSGNALFARDFEPWIPIPSLPYPKIDKKEQFLCPKDGCKDPKTRKSCKGKQNLSESRKNMLSHLLPSYPLCIPIFFTCAN